MRTPTEIIQLAELFVKEELGKDSSGHDFWHIQRVRQMAVRIAAEEGADLFVCELAALLHDIPDEKLNDSKEAGLNKLNSWLDEYVADHGVKEQILSIITNMSYSGGHKPAMDSLEGRVVQDADRLDAIGAIGIARTFAYGGAKGRLMYDPEHPPEEFMTEEQYRKSNGSSINHFYEKLLKLKDLMNTKYAKQIATSRHEYMEGFLTQFYQEWNSEDGK
ncbi:HD domain-containing protein [Paenibacillus albiflavus]|uniref:HD domain-containing protein n=1 Tax=Paenibacillus albiflavus TaxID=2545760 RepID=A0A4R4EKN5_9BACL|nr:HD domain-containing protein [Paenibacillus albiflavus]TCZ79870.1 HD domain-containing protein [Paenibacillus albiflavus]